MMENYTTLIITFLRKLDLTKTRSECFPSVPEYKKWSSFQKLSSNNLPKEDDTWSTHCSTFLMAFLKRLWILIAPENDQHPLHYMVNGPFNRKGNNIQLFEPSKTRWKVLV